MYSASGLKYDRDYLRYIEQNSQSANRWSQFTKAQPAPIYSWYRESQRYLEVMGSGNRGWVSADDPPQDVSGMVSIQLDSLTIRDLIT